MKTENLTIKNFHKPSGDGSDFLETPLWIAGGNEMENRADGETETDENETTVLIRKFPDGDTIAFFPEQPWSTSGNDCASYQLIGQHGSASIHLWNELEHTTPEERAALVKELQSIYGDLKIENFWTGEHARKHAQELKRLREIN